MHGFWLFPYERCNGILGKQPNNNRAIESQLMERFLKDNFVQSFNFPDEYQSEFRPAISEIMSASTHKLLLDDLQVQFPSRCSLGVLDMDDHHLLTCLYGKLHPNETNFTINLAYYNYSSVALYGDCFHCSQSNSKSKSYIAMANGMLNYLANLLQLLKILSILMQCIGL